MKMLAEKTHYEVLEVPSDASLSDIKRAYYDAMMIYGDDALATYSLFSDKQRTDILKIIEIAFQTLIDFNKRALYNQKLFESGKIMPETLLDPAGRQLDFLAETLPCSRPGGIEGLIEMKSSDDQIKSLVAAVEAKERISGEDLKRVRLAFGIEVSEVYKITRISSDMIRNLEENRFDALPARIYVKQFLRSYSEFFQMNPNKILHGYFNNLDFQIDKK